MFGHAHKAKCDAFPSTLICYFFSSPLLSAFTKLHFGGKVLRKTLRIARLLRRECRWLLEQECHWNFRVNYTVFSRSFSGGMFD